MTEWHNKGRIQLSGRLKKKRLLELTENPKSEQSIVTQDTTNLQPTERREATAE